MNHMDLQTQVTCNIYERTGEIEREKEEREESMSMNCLKKGESFNIFLHVLKSC